MFGTLIALGVVSTAYGLYEFYSAFTMWPEEVRADLRAGVKAKRQDNLSLSEKFFQRAWDTAQTLSLSHFGTSPYLKLSGIAISLAEVLEAHERPQPAWDAYVDAIEQFTRLRKQGVPLSGPERMRAVAIASKLGEMAETYQLPLEDEEQWLSWAVSELMKILKEAQPERGADVGGEEPADVPLMLAELEMPPWVSKTTLGAPLEALGNFYARRGKVEYAVPLYLQAINLLVPPSGSNKTSTTEEKCRGAQLMNNLAELTIREAPTPDNRRRAELWARQARGTIERTKAEARGGAEELATCEQALAAVMFNIGSLLEMRGEHEQSRELFKESLDQANRIKMREGTMAARVALRRLERTSIERQIGGNGTNAPSDSPQSQ
ncbi:hypothetical protein SCP_0509400 [Sparassis crispa]|uniref:TPR-like protein n=1 Tax=Sparassis crispa TaxID=139825 RepID=A0A401GNT7_9APHY|nr:hypothetical protein SCP_0509400 [Sparassis crispa]GBE83883.1 hypothetical protein SCP_0509400 [Sparassis crispa]